MPNSKHLTHDINNSVSLITKTKLGLSSGGWHARQEERGPLAPAHATGGGKSARDRGERAALNGACSGSEAKWHYR
jgi:hypothetical protein